MNTFSIILLMFFTPASPAWNVPGTIEFVQSGPHIKGPNCWNSALVESGVLHNLRFVSDIEFSYLIDNACEARSNDPQPGDLGRIHIPGLEKEIHGFNWVDSSSVFAKHSDRSNESYVVMESQAMMDHYWTTRECKINYKDDKHCKSSVDYYSCSTIESRPKLKAQLDILRGANHTISKLVFDEETRFRHGQDCLSSSYLARNQRLITLQRQLKSLTEIEHPDPEYLLLWLQSVKTQFYHVQVSSRSFRCRGQMTRTEKYREYKKTKEIFSQLKSLFQI